MCAAWAEPAWAPPEEYGNAHVIVAADVAPAEAFAAQEFARWWRECTGRDVRFAEPGADGINVWIGRRGVPDPILAQSGSAGLGPDGFCIRTVAPNHLLIVGGSGAGTLYGVYEFFERVMGVRWLAPDATHVPAPPSSLPEIDVRYEPPLAWRDISYRAFGQYPWFAAVHRLNGQHANLPEEMGGSIGFATGFGHTFFSFVDPREYGETHPEYFSEIDGERRVTPNGTQLCLTNPDVLAIVVEKTRRILMDSPPRRRIVSITQMDWGGWCECERCAAVDEREEGHSGTVIRFVNQVAQAIEQEFPDAFIDTFAYMYTRKPPKHARPRDNVIVRLCSIECDFGRPLSDPDSPQNRAFHQDLRDWAAIAPNLWAWDYTQNWYCHQQPHPNFHVLQPNVAFYADNGVTGLFEQASPVSPHSDFEYLKGYLLAKAVWDPHTDWERNFDEFVDLYYREAGPFIREYIDLITRKVRDDDFYLGIFSKMEWMDYDTVVRAESIFDKALAAARDETVRERLRSVHLPVQYAALVCSPRIEVTDSAFILTRPPSMGFDAYWEMIAGMGVSMLEDRPIAVLRERLGGTTPPRREEVGIERLENERYEVWVLPERGGAVVRFADKGRSVDLFRGADSIRRDRWMWQEWHVMDPENPEREEPLDTPYRMVERDGEEIVVGTRLENGLAVRRTMLLPPGAAALDVQMEIRNEGADPVAPRVKSHPEFWTQGAHLPEIWIEKDGRWRRVELSFADEGHRHFGGEHLDPAGITRWSLHVPQEDLTLVVDVDPAGLGSLFYFFDTENEHANLELVPDVTPLAPGETRTVHARYSLSSERPDRLDAGP